MDPRPRTFQLRGGEGLAQAMGENQSAQRAQDRQQREKGHVQVCTSNAGCGEHQAPQAHTHGESYRLSRPGLVSMGSAPQTCCPRHGDHKTDRVGPSLGTGAQGHGR